MTLYGYGDEATWPAYSGHPGDPRAPCEPDIDEAIEDMIDDAASDPDGSAAEWVIDTFGEGFDDDFTAQFLQALRDGNEQECGRLVIQHIMKHIEERAEKWSEEQTNDDE